MKVREVFGDWPPHKWAADDPGIGPLASEPQDLRLLWFSVPDGDGWFSLTATDARGASWSTYCRVSPHLWGPLEQALGRSLQLALEPIGELDLELAACESS